MNALRLLATIAACVIGLGGCALALSNMPFDAFKSNYPPPTYIWTNMLMGVMVPAALSIGLATALLLLVRVDRRLDQMSFRPGAE